MESLAVALLNDPAHGLTALEGPEGPEGEPRVIAAGLARALGYKETARLLALVKDDETGTMEVQTAGGRQLASYLTLSGMFRAMGSRPVSRITDPEIRQIVDNFQDWIYRNVLPAIATTGQYLTPEAQQEYAERAVQA